MYKVSVFYDDNLLYNDLEDVVEKDEIATHTFNDEIDVNEYTNLLNEINQEVDGGFIFKIIKIS